eukprot:4923526-Lingulodinium_polyedra.AAC.1
MAERACARMPGHRLPEKAISGVSLFCFLHLRGSLVASSRAAKTVAQSGGEEKDRRNGGSKPTL